MRIVHLPTELAGQMNALCTGLRQAGMSVNGYNWFRNNIKYKGKIVHTDGYEIAKIIDPLVNNCDIFHFHNGNSALMEYRDLPHIKNAGKKMVMHHWGSDVRAQKWVKQLNPYPLPPSYLKDEQMHERLLITSSYIDHAIVQDYEMVPYVQDYYKHVHVLPLACVVDRFIPVYPDPANQVPVIVHAPTNRKIKGTEHVERAIDELKAKHSFVFRLVEKQTNEEALKTYSSADIVVDQMLIGTYGALSVEAMSLGKVVVAFIRDDVRRKLPPEFPIVGATPETLRDVLSELIQNPAKRHEIGMASRKFAENYHSVGVVTKRLLQIYNQL
ncbi:glycosyltransferase family 1 protein [Marinicrinis lubricantis]|uniref:Glycosyltransferase family 1 protein n=1 Tax=Marinicrinis lubricantis TaxID=2086470 RepID=A0ABW1IL16_9BACL